MRSVSNPGSSKGKTGHRKTAAHRTGEAPREAARPFEPGRAEPPVPTTDDLDPSVAPPLPGKLHPPGEMDDAMPTLDDERRQYHHHPNDAGTTELRFDPEAADAAADLAGDLGSSFLEGATRGEDMSEIAGDSSDRGEDELPLVLDEEGQEPVEDEAPRRPRR